MKGLYLLRRLKGACATLVAILVLSFMLVRLAPGSPLSAEKTLSPEAKKMLTQRYGLDQPLWVQLTQYLTHALRGDLGLSFKYPRQSVAGLLKQTLPATFVLGAMALGWAVTLGILSGLLTAGYPNHLIVRFLFALSSLLSGVPSFVLGPLFVAVFALHWGLVPAAGWGQPRHCFLPVITLGAGYWAHITRLCRAGVLSALDEDYMRFAQAKGLPFFYRLRRHAIWAGLRPVITFVGPACASVLAGSVVVEKLFCIPGMGPLFVDAALNRDYPLVMGIVLLSSIFLLLFQIAADMLLAYIDPRVRLD